MQAEAMAAKAVHHAISIRLQSLRAVGQATALWSCRGTTARQEGTAITDITLSLIARRMVALEQVVLAVVASS